MAFNLLCIINYIIGLCMISIGLIFDKNIAFIILGLLNLFTDLLFVLFVGVIEND